MKLILTMLTMLTILLIITIKSLADPKVNSYRSFNPIEDKKPESKLSRAPDPMILPSKVECFRRLQNAQKNIEKQEVKQSKVNERIKIRRPSDFIISSNEQVAFQDISGEIVVSSINGDYHVTNSCNLDFSRRPEAPKNSFDEHLQSAYEYMRLYDTKFWREEKDYCNTSGVRSPIDEYRPDSIKKLTTQ